MCTSVVLKVVRAKPSQAAAAAAAFVAAEAVEEQRWRLASDRAAADRNERASRARLEAKKKRLALLSISASCRCKHLGQTCDHTGLPSVAHQWYLVSPLVKLVGLRMLDRDGSSESVDVYVNVSISEVGPGIESVLLAHRDILLP